MAIENFDEVKKYLEDNKDADDVKSIYADYLPKSALDSYLDSEDGKKAMQPRLDKHFTKGLETWKANNFKKELEAEISKRFPAETEQDKALRAVQEELAAFKKQAETEKLKLGAVKTLTEKGLPISLADYLTADTTEGMNTIINAIETDFKAMMEKAVNEKIKGTTPPASNTDGTPTGMTKAKLLSMTMPERVKFYQEHQEEFDKLMNS